MELALDGGIMGLGRAGKSRHDMGQDKGVSVPPACQDTSVLGTASCWGWYLRKIEIQKSIVVFVVPEASSRRICVAQSRQSSRSAQSLCRHVGPDQGR